MHYLSQFKGLPKQTYMLAVLKAVLGIGSMVFSFVSLIMTDILGFTTARASLLVMILAFIKALSVFLGGRLADIYGRKVSCIICASFVLVFYGLGGVLCRTPYVVPCIMLGTIGSNGISAPISALMADRTTKTTKAVECFTLLYLGSNLGYSIGPSLGGLLYYNHLPMVFYIQAIVFFLCGVLICFLVDDNYDPTEYRQKRKEEKALGKSAREEGLLKLLWERKALLIFIVGVVILYICYGMLSFMLPLHLRSLFGAEYGARYIGNTWTVNGLVIVFATAFFVSYIKRHHQFVNSTVGALLYAAGFSVYAFSTNIMMFFVSATIWTFGEILVSTGVGNFIASQSPETHRGRFQSLFEAAGFVGKGISPPICAAVISKAGYVGSWKLAAVVCLGVSLLFGLSYKYVIKRSVPNE